MTSAGGGNANGGGAQGGSHADGGGGQGGAPGVCKPGAQKSCYEGPDGTEGVGLCKAGTKTCNADGAWGACDNQVLPKPEDCNTRGDEDCDGTSCSDAIWDRVLEGAINQSVQRVTIDAAGDTFVGGRFEGSLDLGGGPISNAGTQLFLAKYDPTGALVWVDSFPMSTGAQAEIGSIALSASGDIVIGGGVSSGSVTVGSKVVNAGNESRGFVGVFDSGGHSTWVRQVTSSPWASLDAAVFDATGNIVVGGEFVGTMSCATTPCPTSGSNTTQPFVRKYDATGAEQWTHHYDAVGNASVTQIGARSDGHIVVIGFFTNSISLVGNTYAASGDTSYFVVEAGPSGNGAWAFTLGSHGTDIDMLAMKPDDGFVIAGDSSGPLTVAGVSTGGPSVGGAFAFSFSSTGTPLWAKSFAVSGDNAIEDVAVDGQGNIVVVGFIQAGAIDFGGGPISNTAGDYDGVMAKLGPDGSFLWGKTYGGAGDQGMDLIAANASGRIAASANFSDGTIDFGLGAHQAGPSDHESVLVNFQP
jgi:hypothetical protein